MSTCRKWHSQNCAGLSRCVEEKGSLSQSGKSVDTSTLISELIGGKEEGARENLLGGVWFKILKG